MHTPFIAHATAFTVFAALLAAYIATLHNGVAGGDSGELVSEACALGTPHPPGYPLLTMLAAATVRLLQPWGLSPAQSANLLGAVLSAASATQLFYAAFKLARLTAVPLPVAAAPDSPSSKRLSRANLLASLTGAVLAAALHGCSPLVWTYSVGLEVFSLNNLIVCSLLHLAVAFATIPQQEFATPAHSSHPRHRRARIAVLGAAIAGLGASNQHTIVLLALPLALWVTTRVCLDACTAAPTPDCASCGHTPPRTSGMTCGAACAGVGHMVCAFVLCLLPYAYLPLAASLWPRPGSWGDCSTFVGLVRHVLRSDYGTLRLHASDDATGDPISSRLAAYSGDLLWRQGGIRVALLALIGCAWSSCAAWPCPRHKSRHSRLLPELGMVLVAAFGFYIVVFHALANMPLDDDLLAGVLARFWQQPNVIVWLWAGLGCSALLQQLGRACSSRGVGGVVAAVVALCCAVWLVAAQARAGGREASAHGNHQLVGRYGHAVLASLANNSILVASDDLTWGSLNYAQACEGRRPDVTVLNTPLLSHRAWAGARNHEYRDVEFPIPRGALGPRWLAQRNPDTVYTLSDLLHANMKQRPLYFTPGVKVRGDEHGHEAEFASIPVGLALRIVRRPKQGPGSAPQYASVGTAASVALPETVPPPPPKAAAKWRSRSLRERVWARVHAALPPAQLPAPSSLPSDSWEALVVKVYWEARVRSGRWLVQEAKRLEAAVKQGRSHINRGKVAQWQKDTKALVHTVTQAARDLDSADTAGSVPDTDVSSLKDIGLCFYILAEHSRANAALVTAALQHQQLHGVGSDHSYHACLPSCDNHQVCPADALGQWRASAYGVAASAWKRYLENVDSAADPHVASIRTAYEYAAQAGSVAD